MTTRKPFLLLGIAGSLREGSYNKFLLRAAQELAPEGVEIEIYDGLANIPHFNQDVWMRGEPEAVKDLKERIDQADALLIATPEYNFSVPGVLKTAIEWASRPAMNSVLKHKPVAIMGASMGNFGTVRAQLALRQILLEPDARVLPKPEVLVAQAQNRFDAEGNLTDETTRQFIQDLLTELVAWTEEFSRPQTAPAAA